MYDDVTRERAQRSGAAAVVAPSRATTTAAVSTSYMSPIFHFTAHDVTITAMEHDNHCKLLALATSRGEVYVTQTSEMPVIENVNLHMVRQAHEQQQQQHEGQQQQPSAAEVPCCALPVDERLLDWDCAAMTVLVDRIDSGDVCTQLAWAPWQHGVCLAALCAGVQLRFYHYAHGRWALDTCVAAPGCAAFAFSAHLTVACACAHGVVELRSARAAAAAIATTTASDAVVVATGNDSSRGDAAHAWLPCSRLRMADADELARNTDRHTTNSGSNNADRGTQAGAAQQDKKHNTDDGDDAMTAAVRVACRDECGGGGSHDADCVCVSWDDTGTLLAVGTRDGVVRVLYVVEDGSRIHHLAYRSSTTTAPMAMTRTVTEAPHTNSAASCTHVVWAPLSGRSFCALAVVLSMRVMLVLFARPQQQQQQQQTPQHSSPSHRGAPPSSSTMLHYTTGPPPPPPHLQRSVVATTSAASSSSSLLQLRVLASTTVACEGVVRLSWNTTGTRFVTSHMDNAVRVWSLCVTHTPTVAANTAMTAAGQLQEEQQQQRSGVVGSDEDVMAAARRRAASGLRVSVRHVSTSHPYHSMTRTSPPSSRKRQRSEHIAAVATPSSPLLSSSPPATTATAPHEEVTQHDDRPRNNSNNDNDTQSDSRTTTECVVHDTVDDNAQVTRHAAAQRKMRDPVYRIMHAVPRSDVLEVVRCRFAAAQCTRAAQYFDESYTQNPLRRLRLQLGCDAATGLRLFYPRIALHRHTLRTVDLSRNRLTTDDVVALCAALNLSADAHVDTRDVVATHHARGQASAAHPPPATTTTTSAAAPSLELLDLSYNSTMGNAGAVYVLRALQHHTAIRAVQLKCVGVDDEGAREVAALLRCRRRPPPRTSAQTSTTHGGAVVDGSSSSSSSAASDDTRPPSFFVNLNENRIGALGTALLGKGLPDYVAVTLCKQRVLCTAATASSARRRRRDE